MIDRRERMVRLVLFSPFSSITTALVSPDTIWSHLAPSPHIWFQQVTPGISRSPLLSAGNNCNYLITPGNLSLSHSPLSLPFIGHLYRLGKTPVEALHEHRKKYGDVFRLDSGPLPSVFLCNYEHMTKVLKQDATAGRPHHLIPGYVLAS